MCGIVGYVGNRPALDILVAGLKRLEYRGYDSAGVAYFDGDKVEIRKAEGKLENVEKLLAREGALSGAKAARCGIGHTRWATHGKPTTQNAHPHRTDHVVLVHNGIIENYLEIKKRLAARGIKPKSDTDSELFGYLVLEEMEKAPKAPFPEAVRRAFKQVHGQCSVVLVSEKFPGMVVGVRNGSPLVAARDPQGGAVLASDAQPILAINKDVYFLEHGDVAVATDQGLSFLDLETGKPVKRSPTRLDWSVEALDKGGFPHYMLKEIHEQPTALVDTFNGVLDRVGTKPFQFAKHPGVAFLKKAKHITIVACGTSFHAGLLGRYWLERWSGLSVNVELASEFRYRQPVIPKGTLIIGISQSGETADTLAVIQQAKKLKLPTLGITNVRGSTLSREAKATFFTSAGPEIGVASTKAFTTQLLMLLMMSGMLGLKRPKEKKQIAALFADLIKLPHLLMSGFARGGATDLQIREVAQAVERAKGFFFIGRGLSFPVALEGALKLKEIAYVHAEGYAAGELKHGPIAMIDKDMVVIVIAPKDVWRDKTVSNLEEVKARGAIIVGVGTSSDSEMQGLCDHWIPMPEAVRDLHPDLLPFATTPVVQMLSYELALLKGTDIDKPRNLAKSVTVE